MSYTDDWLSGRDIPTVRRMAYLCKGTDDMKSGYLYAHFRNHFSFFNLGTFHNFSVESVKFLYTKKMERANQLLDELNLPPIFTDVNDLMKDTIIHDYYWGLQTKEQFVAQEAFARAGLLDFPPIEPSKLLPSFGFKTNYEELIAAFDKDRFDIDTLTYWTGEKRNGMNQGNGILYFHNGDIYEGELLDGKFHGKGKLQRCLQFSSFWSGEWRDGKPWTGKGSYVESETMFLGVSIPAVIVEGTYVEGRIKQGKICSNKIVTRDTETFVGMYESTVSE